MALSKAALATVVTTLRVLKAALAVFAMKAISLLGAPSTNKSVAPVIVKTPLLLLKAIPPMFTLPVPIYKSCHGFAELPSVLLFAVVGIKLEEIVPGNVVVPSVPKVQWLVLETICTESSPWMTA